jgi:hypothetical protein
VRAKIRMKTGKHQASRLHASHDESRQILPRIRILIATAIHTKLDTACDAVPQ